MFFVLFLIPPPPPFLFPYLLHSLFSASACFLTLVFVWASAAVIIPRQDLTETNVYALRHKNPQRIGPQDECCAFHALEMFSYM